MRKRKKGGEVWKWVVGYEGYYKVSNQGRIKSVDRIVHRSRTGNFILKGRILRQSRGRKPTDRPGVRLSIDGKFEGFRAQRLVLEAFDGPKLPNKECCHRND